MDRHANCSTTLVAIRLVGTLASLPRWLSMDLEVAEAWEDWTQPPWPSLLSRYSPVLPLESAEVVSAGQVSEPLASELLASDLSPMGLRFATELAVEMLELGLAVG